MSSSATTIAADTSALPPPPPKPQQSGSNPADSQGVRSHDQDSIKPHIDGKPPGAKKRTQPKSTLDKKVPSSAAPVNDLRIAARLRPSRPVAHPEPNWFLPSFTMLFSVLGALCDKVCALRNFGERGSVNNWIPQSAFLVYMVLAYIQVLRAQQLAGLITPDQKMFLDYFLSIFPLELIMIPGPLVPFFRSLSVANPGFGNFEDVTPAIPPLGFDEEKLFQFVFWYDTTTPAGVPLSGCLPSIPLFYSEFVRLISFLLTTPAGVNARRNTFSGFTLLGEQFGVTARPAAGHARNGWDANLRDCAFAHRPNASDALYTRFSDYIRNHDSAFPAPWVYDDSHAAVPGTPGGTAPAPANWLGYTGTSDMFMMTNASNWFGILLSGNDSFLEHWNGNQSLLSLHPTTSTAPLIIFREQTWFTPPATSIFGITDRLNNSSGYLGFNAKCTTTCPFISMEDYEDSQLAMVNIMPAPAALPSFGHVGQTHFGDYWSVTPNVEESDRADINQEIKSLAVGKAYFLD